MNFLNKKRKSGAHLIRAWSCLGLPSGSVLGAHPLTPSRGLSFGRRRPRGSPGRPPTPSGLHPRRPACRPAGASRASLPHSCLCPPRAGSSRRPGACSRHGALTLGAAAATRGAAMGAPSYPRGGYGGGGCSGGPARTGAPRPGPPRRRCHSDPGRGGPAHAQRPEGPALP